MSATVLSFTPLSQPYRQALEAKLGLSAPRYAPFTELRAHKLLGMLRAIWRLDAPWLIVAEDLQSLTTLPLLQSLAGLMARGEMRVVLPDFRVIPLSRSGALASGVALAARSIAALGAVARARMEVRRLATAARVDARRGEGSRTLYLKTNFMLGARVGGSIGHVQGVVSALAETGRDLEYFAAEPPLAPHPHLHFHAVPLPETFGFPIESNYYRYHFDYVRQVLREIRPREYGLIYHRMSICNYAGVVVSRRTKLPLIIEYNGSDAWIQRHWDRPLKFQQLAEDAENVCLHHAHIVATQSNVLRDELLERGVPEERIVVYPNCVDANTFDSARFDEAARRALRQRLGIAPDALVVAFVGTFGRWHGTETLAQAIRILTESHGDAVSRHRLHFLLIGDGLRMAAVREILATPACAAITTLPGLVPQLETPAYLAAADILCSPHVQNADGSRFFGSPTKLFEYMSMGKPIVASDLEQLGEVLKNSVRIDALPAGEPAADDDRLALLVPPGNAEAIARGILFLAERPSWRSTLGRNVRREVERRYTWHDHVAAILERYDRLYPRLGAGDQS